MRTCGNSAIIGAAFTIGMIFIPETLPRIVISNAAKRTNSITPEDAVVVEAKVNVMQELRFVTTMALRIMSTEPIVIFLALYNGFA